MNVRFPRPARTGLAVRLLLCMGLAAACLPVAARAQASSFPDIAVWAYPGAYRPTGGADSIQARARTLTVRFMRDPAAEARSDFGGYRLYRVQNAPDTSRLMLVRRFSRQKEDSLFLWNLRPINAGTPDAQRIITYIDPDSSGSFVKRCRTVDEFGRCTSRGDSIFVLLAPPGPHNGFRTWFTVTYEQKNGLEADFQELYVKDPACTNPDTTLCLNLNNKLRNLTAVAVEATPGPTANLQTVSVVPNPFRAAEAWDQAGGNEVHFINLPSVAKIRIYTIAGDLVRELEHSDTVRDFAIWDLKNGSGEDVSSGIYVYRVESGVFNAQNRFVVIR